MAQMHRDGAEMPSQNAAQLQHSRKVAEKQETVK
jgi:hypothetical protein